MWNVMQQLYLPKPTKEQWKSIEIDYREKWQFPHCIGAVDGKHVVITKPGKSGSSYFNYKHTFSIVLMVTVDAQYRFTTIDVGSKGDTTVSPIQEPMPFVLVGDEAFPLSENLMRPYPKRSAVCYENKVFNYRCLVRVKRLNTLSGYLLQVLEFSVRHLKLSFVLLLVLSRQHVYCTIT